MITVNISKNKLIISGHSGYATEGSDIVCSAMSQLAITFIESMKAITHDLKRYTIRKGYTEVLYKDLSEYGKVLMHSFFIGVSRLKEMADEYVEINLEEMPWK